MGVKDISIQNIWNGSINEQYILSISRIPRTIALVLAGVGISVCGLIMMQITQNKFVSPTTAGSLDAAKLGILCALIFLPNAGFGGKILFTFGITFLASIIFLKIADKIRYRNIIFIPIVGLMFGGIINSITSFIGYQKNIIQDVGAGKAASGSWMMGDFSGILEGNYELLYLTVPAIVITYIYANQFTVVGMGEAFAKNLGVSYRMVMNIGLFSVSLTISAISITIGIIPFLGLVVPNIVSIIFGDNLRKTLPYTAVFGAIFLLICDIISRLIIFPYEVPIGMTVGLIGGIAFLILLFKQRR